MRIAVVGGRARSLVNFRGHLIREMVRGGHDVFGLAPPHDPAIPPQVEALGATYLPVAISRAGMNPLRDLRSLFDLWRVFRRIRPDMVLCYTIKPVIFGTLAARLAGVPSRFVMITGRGSILQGRPRGAKGRAVRRLVQALYGMALRRSKGVLFQNTDDLGLFSGEGMLPSDTPRKVINGSGVDLAHFDRVPQPEGPLVFLFLGRLLRDKGIREFVEACRILHARGHKATFRIVGDLDPNPTGIRAEEVQRWSEEGIVEYLGPTKDVRPAIGGAHVLVLPSYSEGTPRSVLEAMSMGRAIVTTRAPGCRETVEEGRNGFLVPVAEAEPLAEAMARFIQDPGLASRCGDESRALAESKYDVQLVTREILAFLGLQEE